MNIARENLKMNMKKKQAYNYHSYSKIQISYSWTLALLGLYYSEKNLRTLAVRTASLSYGWQGGPSALHGAGCSWEVYMVWLVYLVGMTKAVLQSWAQLWALYALCASPSMIAWFLERGNLKNYGLEIWLH